MFIYLAFILVLLLAGCSGNNPTPGPPPVGEWQQNCNAGLNMMVGNKLVLTFPNTPPGACYAWTGITAKLGQILTLNYSVTGNNPVWQNNPTGGDTGAPTVHLLLWQKGDNGSCAGDYNFYRLFASRAPLVLGDNQILSAQLTAANWQGCYPAQVLSDARLQTVLNNLLGAGITFGGQSFAGHGIYLSSGSASFTINSFTAQ